MGPGTYCDTFNNFKIIAMDISKLNLVCISLVFGGIFISFQRMFISYMFSLHIM